MHYLRFSLIVGLVGLLPAAAQAFSTRVHILIANQVRESALQGDGTLRLRLSQRSARLSAEDAQALSDHPLAFRAGAIGPDNMVFPGMTDPSHAIEQRPFEQCELLYKLALTPEERAYAMGCFLHGSTDAIAHHYVNYMAGETFTLTPITKARTSAYSNVVRHILAESMIQKAAFEQRPDEFRTGQMIHTIPRTFLLRAYFSEDSPLWQLVARRAKEKYDAAVAKNPTASLPTIVAGLDVGPADHLVLVPVYLRSIDGIRRGARDSLVSSIAAMQNQATAEGMQLKVTAGADGKLGTSDDKTACVATCATLYAKYFTYVALLAPRYDAGMNVLPSAFDKISDKLRDDLGQFLPAYLQTVENLSAELNTPLTVATNDFELDAGKVSRLFLPLDTWASKVTTIDYESLARSVTPEWLQALQDALRNVGITVSISGILEAALKPVVQPIKDTLKAYAVDQAKRFITDIADEYKRTFQPILTEYDTRLRAAAGPGLTGQALDHLFDSGLFVHSFNIAATALAAHAVVLPVGEDAIGVGPASFDASYTPAWMQASLCPYLRPEIFPLGIDVRGSLSVRDAMDHPARVEGDSPVECHDGSLSAFATSPSAKSCAFTELVPLIADPGHKGSLTRAFPPAFAQQAPTCQNVVVPGLPGPAVSGDLGPADGGAPPDEMPAGCGCRIGAASPAGGATQTGPGPGPAIVALLGLGLVLRRRAARLLVACGLLAGLAASGCSPSDVTMNEDGGPDGGADLADPGDLLPGPDMNTSARKQLLDALNQSVWSGTQTRAGKERAYELRFDTKSLLWAEIGNPFGPARRRELRVMSVEADGVTVRTTVNSPLVWPEASEIGRKDEWSVTIVPGTPRRLRAVRNGVTEEFVEGPWPAPTGGLTATVRAFSANGNVDKAFCSSGANGFKYNVIFDYARGSSAEPLLGSDLAAGAKLLRWTDPSGMNRFSVTDVHGFRPADLGGTNRSEQANFFVRYRGTIKHPGGAFQLRELDDVVEDGLWVFVGSKVGSSATGDVFLEVHGFVWSDLTDDAPSVTLPAGDVQIEIITVRCAKQISNMDVQIRLGGGAYQLVGDAPSAPEINEALFPPAL